LAGHTPSKPGRGVGGHHRIHAGRLDAEVREAVHAAHARHLQRAVVVHRERLAGREFHEPRLDAREPVRQAQDAAVQALEVAHVAHDLLERLHLGSAELVALAVGAPVVERARERLGDVADVHRREARVGAGERERQRHRLEQAREAVDEGVAGPEDHRRLEHGGLERGIALREQDPFRLALGAQVVRGALGGVGVERAHLQESRDPGALRRVEQLARELGVCVAEARAVAAALVEDADQVDHGVGTFELARQRLLVVDVGGHQAHRRQHQHVAVTERLPRQHLEAMAVGGQPGGEVPADEPGAAEHDDALDRHT
jgi:hypothetical protein